jgi:aminoglycoside phosphotransferase (APT) family kinase protein
MIDDEIVTLARNINPKVEPKDIMLLEGGFSSQAYKVSVGDEPFVLLVERVGAVGTVNYGNSYLILTLLKKHGYKYAPQPLWLKDDHQAMAMSYFDGTASDKFDFSNVNAEDLAIKVIDALLDTIFVTLDEYNELAKKFNVTQNPIQTTQEGAQIYGVEWLEVVKRSCPDIDIINWLEPRVERSVQLAEKLGNHTPTFGHGDPSNPNILIKQNGDFMLIDWDSAKFHTSGPEFYVAYTTHLTDFMGPFRGTLVKHVAKRFNITEEEFATRVTEFRQRTEVFDVNWAAMMMAKVNSGEAEGNINNFRNIANERIKLYEHDFGSSI